MCIGIPMQVVSSMPGSAICEVDGERRQVDTMLVGEQPVGTWLMVFLDAAREVLTPEDAAKITDALSALNMAMSGSETGTVPSPADFDHLFADIVRAADNPPPATDIPDEGNR